MRAQIQFQVTGVADQFVKVGDIWFFAPVKIEQATGKVSALERCFFPQDQKDELMTKVWIGDCVLFDAETQDMALLPLLECLRYAVLPDRPVDFFLKSILGENGPGGGDPGWSIHWIARESEALVPSAWRLCMSGLPGDDGCYEAWTNQAISDLDPPCAYYSRRVVYHHIREVLENFRVRNPERTKEVNLTIGKFESQGV